MKTPKKKYERRKEYYNKILVKQNKSLNVISNLRLTVALVGLVNISFLYITKNYTLGLPIALVYVSIFTYLVVKHTQLKSRRSYTQSLFTINDKGLRRINGDWKGFEDTGEEFRDEEHSFSHDLDVFGKGSLFQWINTTKTFMGRKKLVQILTNPCEGRDEIYKRQEAVGELANKLWWRNRFMAEGMVLSDEIHNPEHLYGWAKDKKEDYLKSGVILGVRLLPVISIILVILYLTNRIPYKLPLIFLGIQTLILKFRSKERHRVLNIVYKHKDNIKAYRRMLEQLEKRHFKSEYMKDLKKQLVNDEKYPAFQQIDRLEKIVDGISNRNNAVFIIINILILWDYQCMISLERWKKKSGIHIKSWLDTIGEVEALSSLSIIRHDNPEWAMPEIVQKSSQLRAKEMGHPLLTSNRVCNDLRIDHPTKILLITGSNMSGKSTLLRTAGINLLLAYIGAPACAKTFSASFMSIQTCMRVSDNLEKSISSFYAELLRIKEIVKETSDKQVFFLLDEIFKGTNSEDRHEGAKILINKLLRDNAVGLVSTHDLELGVLEKDSNKKIANYHFQEYYKDNEIQFDYKLRPGVSTTRNALYLIKMIGIDDKTI